MFKQDNTALINEASIAKFEEWIQKTYNITPSNIDQSGLTVENLYYMVFSWRDTEAASVSTLNTIPTWFTKALNQYCLSSAKYAKSTNSLQSYNNTEDRTYIYNIIQRNVADITEDNGAGGFAITFDLTNEVSYPVPEGYDGNLAFVKLYVPSEVITALHLRKFDVGTSIATAKNRQEKLYHPLLRGTQTYFEGSSTVVNGIEYVEGITNTGGWEGGYGTPGVMIWGQPSAAVDTINSLTSQIYGNLRHNPVLFYSSFTEKNNLSIDVQKFKDEIKIKSTVVNFKKPFANTVDGAVEDADLIAPKILVDIKFMKYGAN